MIEKGILEAVGWSLTCVALIGTVLNSQMKVSGFYFWLVSNTGFMLINWYNCVYSQVALFLINNIVCVIGIVSWVKKVKK